MSNDEIRQVSFDDLKINRYHILVITMQFLFFGTCGYSLGTISIGLVSIEESLPVNVFWQGLLASSAFIGLLIGCLVFGIVGDRAGRKRLLLASAIFVAILSSLQYFVTSLVALFFLRVLIGIALGTDYSVGVTLLAEFAPTKRRSTLLATMSLLWTVGYVGASFVGVALTGAEAWRVLLASAAIPTAVVIVLATLIPESPRFLISQERFAEARTILDRCFGANVYITDSSHEKNKAKVTSLFSKRNIRGTLLSCAVFVGTVIPYFGVYTFLPTLLAAFGLAEDFTVDLLLNFLLIMGSLIAILYTPRMTRKASSTLSFGIVTVSLALLTIAGSLPTGLAVAIFVIFALFISGAANFTQVIPVEVMPTEIRSTGVGFAAATSRLAAALGTFLTPITIATLGMPWSLGIMAAFCGAAAATCFVFAPNTREVSLSETSSAVAHASGAT